MFFRGAGYALILTNNWLGYILGDFFTNSSGHPGHNREEQSEEKS
jgi:hypothetical protein